MCTCSGSCNCNSTTIPKGPQGAQGNQGIQGVQGLPGDNGNYVVQTVEPEGLNCPAGGVKIQVFDGVDNTLINTTYVCNFYNKGIFFIKTSPQDLNAAPASPATIRRVIDGNIIIFDTADSFPTFNGLTGYNPTTGVWTCPETGRYDLSFFVHYESPTDDGWLLEGGYFLAGICGFGATANNVYVVSNHTVGQNNLFIEISGALDSFPINVGSQLCLKVINCTSENYVSDVGDTVKMCIRKSGNI
jgi:hypothetical protein